MIKIVNMAEKVVNAKSSKDTKQIASEVKMPGSWWDYEKYGIMREVLIAKIGSNKFFRGWTSELWWSDFSWGPC